MRHSIACPRGFSGSLGNVIFAPLAAMRICSATRSIPMTISVTGCSTWTRVFISMKYSSPRSSMRNSSVPAEVYPVSLIAR
jgi:hypothetical protein